MQETSLEVLGQPLRVLEAGSGPPLLFLHGAGGLSWNPLLERLSATHRVIAPEHPGFGRTEIPAWMMSVGDLAFFYLDVLEALDLREVDLVGLSMGGWTAAELAIRDTSRLRTLTLMAPAGVRSEVPFGDIFLWSPEESARRGCFNPEIAEQRVRALAEADLDTTLRNRAATARLAWNPRLHNPQLPFWLHRIDVPTLLVWGTEDQVVPFACAESYRRGIPGAQLLALPETGHALPAERPAEIAERLEAFFAEVRS
ncbi:alpha/beta fold hydrolase [Roseomonas sp. BN140053]|uniref:alpha/beta fold hydrolase n=1 Tax=Roseomonas sp. BN140053 TaxID=3391898 RepID=UPI0039ED607F